MFNLYKFNTDHWGIQYLRQNMVTLLNCKGVVLLNINVLLTMKQKNYKKFIVMLIFTMYFSGFVLYNGYKCYKPLRGFY